MTSSSSPKIMFLDIETTNFKADFGHLLCVGWKFSDQSGIACSSLAKHPAWFRADPTNDKQVAFDTWIALQQADILVTYNGIRFDLPFLITRFTKHRFGPIPPLAHVDLYYTARSRFATSRKKQEIIAKLVLGKTRKTHLDMQIWSKAGAGDKKSLEYIIKHCKADVADLADMYYKMRHLIKTHPFVGEDTKHCRWCGGRVTFTTDKVYGPTKPKVLVRCEKCRAMDTRQVGRTSK